MSGRLDHVVGAADEPVVTIRIASRQVAGQVEATGETLRGSARRRRGTHGTSTASPAAARARPAPPVRRSPSRRLGVRRTIAASTPGNGRPIEPGRISIDAKFAIMMPPVSVCHQLSWNGWPKRVDAPHHGFRIQRLADAAEKAQATQIVRRASGAPAFINMRIAVGAVYQTVTRSSLR